MENELDNLLNEELFEEILKTKSISKRAIKEEELFEKAKKIKKLQLVKSAYYSYKKQQAKKNNELIFDENVSLNVPGYSINDYGQIMDYNGNLVTATIIYPLNIYVNVQSGEEIVECRYKIMNKWATSLWSKDILLTTSKIIELSKKGIDVSSESAKLLVSYFRQVFNNNEFERKKSTQKLGWKDKMFIPFDQNILFDGEEMFSTFSNSYHSLGSYDVWLNEVKQTRKFNKIVRIAMGTSFAAPLLKLLNRDSFVTIIWGESGCGKSALARVTQSIWGRNIISEDIATCKHTPYVIGQFADMYNNLPVIFDELQLYEGDLNDLIMMLCENSEKGRGRSSGGLRRICNWRTSFTITGEESGVRANTSGGALNRLIEIYCSDKIIENGIKTCEILNENYGHAGKKYIEYIKTLSVKDLNERFKRNLENINNLGKTAEKQAISMALILLGDQLACECIFLEEKPLTVFEIQEFLRDKSEIDNTQNAYRFFVDQVSSNINKFTDYSRKNDGIASKTEHLGFIDKENNKVYVVSSKLPDLFNNQFDVKKCLNKWEKLGLVNRNKNTGKFVKQIRVSKSIIANYYEINLPKIDDDEREIEIRKQKYMQEDKELKDFRQKQSTVDVVNQYKGTDYTQNDLFLKVGGN